MGHYKFPKRSGEPGRKESALFESIMTLANQHKQRAARKSGDTAKNARWIRMLMGREVKRVTYFACERKGRRQLEFSAALIFHFFSGPRTLCSRSLLRESAPTLILSSAFASSFSIVSGQECPSAATQCVIKLRGEGRNLSGR
jgi:hypothetical protein